MAVRGRPPKPVEEKRRIGNPGKRPLPEPSNVIALQPASDVPPYPPDLGLDGRRLWDQAWQQAIAWLSPASDMAAIEEACRLVDDVAIARYRYRATTDPADARALVALTGQLTSALSALGFDPTSRSRLGVAEVKAVSAIDKLLERRNQRQGGR